MIKKFFLLLVFLGLIYMLVPSPLAISDFDSVPQSLKSNEVGDTVQVPNIAAYFSQLNRAEITKFYTDEFRKKFIFGELIPPIVLNYPPDYAKTYIRDQQMSTFLIEIMYPFKGSLFVNGFEPEIDNKLKNKTNPLGNKIYIDKKYFNSKATVRYYAAPRHLQVLIYLGICFSIIAMLNIFVKARKQI